MQLRTFFQRTYRMDRLQPATIGKRFLIISRKKDSADMGVASMLMTIALLLMGYWIAMYLIQAEEIRTARNMMQQGLALTSLSAGISDDERMAELGMGQIIYDQSSSSFIYAGSGNAVSGLLRPEDTFQKYISLMETNVERCMDTYRDALGHSRFSDMKLQQFILYNVEGTTIEIYESQGNSLILRETVDCSLQEVRTPTGELVQSSSIYGELSFSYQDLFGRIHSNLSIKQYSAVRIRGRE